MHLYARSTSTAATVLTITIGGLTPRRYALVAGRLLHEESELETIAARAETVLARVVVARFFCGPTIGEFEAVGGDTEATSTQR